EDPGHAFANHGVRHRVADVDDGDVLDDEALRLFVQRHAVLEAGHGLGLFEDRGDLGVRVAVALSPAGHVERMEEVVGVGVVGEPGEVERGRPPTDGVLDKNAEVNLVDCGRDADLAEEELDQLVDGNGGLGARGPDLHLEPVRVTGLGQELPGAFGVVRDRLDRVVVPGETGRYGRVGELVGAVVWAVDDRLTVYCHGDRAAHAHVLELFNALVEGEVEDRQLIDGLELVRVLRIVYHVQQERRGDAGNVEVASVELLPGDERVRDDAVVDAVDVRPTGEVALVGGQV